MAWANECRMAWAECVGVGRMCGQNVWVHEQTPHIFPYPPLSNTDFERLLWDMLLAAVLAPPPQPSPLLPPRGPAPLRSWATLQSLKGSVGQAAVRCARLSTPFPSHPALLHCWQPCRLRKGVRHVVFVGARHAAGDRHHLRLPGRD
eukprot:360379-Chlamydomonas_euryale.AAC.2